ncbi:hypothetical protein HBB16_08645 [Pseudonocardia sp. MCCB 268]|nr:hypothetical protein [Pseudonocardia cytotoxica]
MEPPWHPRRGRTRFPAGSSGLCSTTASSQDRPASAPGAVPWGTARRARRPPQSPRRVVVRDQCTPGHSRRSHQSPWVGMVVHNRRVRPQVRGTSGGGRWQRGWRSDRDRRPSSPDRRPGSGWGGRTARRTGAARSRDCSDGRCSG